MSKSKRPSMKTTHSQIVEWGQRNINEIGYGVDASQMDSHCWRCGHECSPEHGPERPTERCHVIPYSLGGEDIPSNYRLFCHDCHLEQPNVNDYEATDKWVRETNIGTYNIFWVIRETFDEVYEETISHFGKKTNQSTLEWIYAEFERRLSSKGISTFFIGHEKIQNCLFKGRYNG